MKDLSKFECYDNLIVNPLEGMGWICDQVPWDTNKLIDWDQYDTCLLYTSPSPRDATLSRMPSSA